MGTIFIGTWLFGACDYFTVEGQEMFVRTKFCCFQLMPCAPQESLLFVADDQGIELPKVVGRSVGWAWLRYLSWLVFLSVTILAVLFRVSMGLEEPWPWALVTLAVVCLGFAIFVTVYKPKASEESKQKYLNLVCQVMGRQHLHGQTAAATAVHGSPAHQVVTIQQPQPYPGLHKDNVNVTRIAGVLMAGSPTGIPTHGNPSGIPTYTHGNPTGIPAHGNSAGIPAHGNPTGIPTKGNPTGVPTHGNTSGIITPRNPTYIPTRGNPTGIPTHGITNGIPTHGNAYGISTHGNPTGIPTHRNPTGNPTHEKPTSIPTHWKPTGIPSNGNPTGIPSQGNPAGNPTQGNPTGVPTHRNPTGIHTHGNPSVIHTHGNPSGIPTHENPTGISTHGNPTGIPTHGNPSGIPTHGNATDIPTHENLTGIPTHEKPTGIPTHGNTAGLRQPMLPNSCSSSSAYLTRCAAELEHSSDCSTTDQFGGRNVYNSTQSYISSQVSYV